MLSDRCRALFVAVIAAILTFGVVAPALATNKGSVSSDTVSGCSLTWTASAVNNTALTNTDPTYPNLMVDLAGNPVDAYSNGGYIKEVSPALGDAGLLEMQHLYYGSAPATTMVFRIPLATQYATAGGTMTVTLPAGYTYTPAVLPNWDYVAMVYGAKTPPQFMSAVVTPTITGSGNVFTVTYPAMPKDSRAYPVAFSASIGSESTAVNRVATATYKATYVQGAAPSCPVTVPPAPVPDPASVCQAYLTGHSVFPLTAADITVREKWDNYGAILLSGWKANRSTPAPLGEINADGWGMPNLSLRLYAAANVSLTGVDLTWTAAQGFTFKPGNFAVVTGSPYGMGQLPANGYTVAATGFGTPTLSADGKSITVHVDSMPAMSAIALGALATPDGSGQALVINETMIGTMADQSACMPLPKIAVDITASGTYLAGQTVTFTTSVTNPGTVPVAPTLTVSNTTGLKYVSGDTDGDGMVDPGETWVYTSTHLVTAADVTAGSVTATATVTGSDGYDITPDPTATDTASVPTAAPSPSPSPTPTVTVTPTATKTPTVAPTSCPDCSIIDSGTPGPDPALLGLGAVLLAAGVGVGVRARFVR